MAKTTKAEQASNATLAALGSNLDGDPGIGVTEVSGVVDTGERVRIILEENDNIPPSGQFFGVNGKGYMLRPGEEASVPMAVIEILNNAIMSTPVTNAEQSVIGYRDKLRFPYRVLAASGSARV